MISVCQLFYAQVSSIVVSFVYTKITSSNMASKATRDQLVTLSTAGANNRDITNQLDVRRSKAVFDV